MSLEVIYGATRNRTAAQELAKRLQDLGSQGSLYLGYPVLTTSDERVEVDALLVSSDHGLCAFLLADDAPTPTTMATFVEEQDRLFAVLESHLKKHEGLRRGRQLAISPATLTVFPVPVSDPPATDGFYGDMESAILHVRGLAPIGHDVLRSLEAAIQRVSTIKPAKKRAAVTGNASRGAVMKVIEKGIANLDRWQKSAAIETPDGPQRIRGLAGSGKTVVLAFKAALWHTQEPTWRIAVTFHTRSLYQQFVDLVTRFTFEHSNDLPDFEALQIVHSWGSSSRAGIYSMIARALGTTPLNWAEARDRYGLDTAFQGACRELLDLAKEQPEQPIFDGILIDEAQDLPPEFFQLVYRFTKAPKRVVWGYDELQKLSESAMPTTDELFGTGPDGQSLVSLENAANSARRDIVLPVCYRNTPWALATAHALGIGVYRVQGLLQHPDSPSVWQEIGYEVTHGRLEPGGTATLARRRDSSPPYFADLLTPSDAVVVHSFPTETDQDRWIADQIQLNITRDELEPDDILIVLPDTYRAKSRAPRLMRELQRHDITSHLAGVTSSVDEVFRAGSVAIAHIYRAKGNEAPMVYAADAQYAAGTFNAVTRRNTLFTAITRSRAWVRITGYGPEMAAIQQETADVVSNDFKLRIQLPTPDELARMRHIHRDRPAEDEHSVRRATENLEALFEAMDRGEVDLHDLPPHIRTRLVAMGLDVPDADGQ